MKILLCIALMMVSQISLADWDFLLQNSNGDQFYVDPNTIKRTPRGVRMWMLMDTGKSGDKKQTYLSAKALDEYVCAEDMYRNLETIEYSEHMGSGDGVSSTSAPARSFTYVVPGTAGERLMNYACSYTKPEKKKPLPKDKSGKSAAEQLFGDLPPLPWPAPKAKAKSEPATEI